VKKIVLLNEADKVITQISDKNIVLVGGCFDLFHYGHLIFLDEAKKQGDFLIVALESDDFIKKYKKRVPIHQQNQRAEILSAIDYVDVIIKLPLFTSDGDYDKLVKLIRPSVIATSFGDPLIEKKKEQAESVKGKVKVIKKFVKNLSTRKIIQILKLEL